MSSKSVKSAKQAAKLAAAAAAKLAIETAAATETPVAAVVEATPEAAPIVAEAVVAPAPVFTLNPASVGLVTDFCEKLGLVLGDNKVSYVQSKGDAYVWIGAPENKVSVYADAGKNRPAGLFKAGKRLTQNSANTLIAILKGSGLVK